MCEGGRDGEGGGEGEGEGWGEGDDGVFGREEEDVVEGLLLLKRRVPPVINVRFQ